jgi:hypothetical protein
MEEARTMRLAMLGLSVLAASAMWGLASAKENVRPANPNVYEGTTSAVVKLEDANGQVGEYPASIMEQPIVITRAGHLKRDGGRSRWGVTPIPGKRYDGTAGTGTQWTMLVNPELDRLMIMRSQFVDNYLYCLFQGKSEPGHADAARFTLADSDLTKCSIQTSFERELGDPGLIAIAAGITVSEVRLLFNRGTLRVVVVASNAAKEIERQFTTYKSTVFPQCEHKLGPIPRGSAGFAEQQFKNAVDVARWNSKHAECIANGVADPDRPFWKRWAAGRRRDVEAAEWRVKNLNPGGPNPIRYDGLGGYKPGTCQACMP